MKDMKPEEKQLLMIDLCARLPHGIVVSIYYPTTLIGQKSKKLDIPLVSIDLSDNTCTVGDSYGKTSGLRMFNRKGELLCKPYLRPMSSMTDEEKTLMATICLKYVSDVEGAVSELSDFYNSRHFDYRGLIPMGLALEAKEGMYKTERI